MLLPSLRSQGGGDDSATIVGGIEHGYDIVMTDLFPMEFPPEDRGLAAGTGSSPVFEDGMELVRAPMPILYGAFGAVVLALLCFLPGARTFNVIGYVIAGLLVAALVIWFRSVDRRHRRSPRYVFMQNHRLITTMPLILGILTAAGHAYFLAQQSSVAR